SARAETGGGNCVDRRQPGGSVNSLHACGVHQRRRKSKRPELVETVHDAIAEVIVVHAPSRTNGALAGTAPDLPGESAFTFRGVSDRQAGSEVFIVPRPIRFLAVCLSRQAECEQRLVRLSLTHGCRTLLEPAIEALVRRYLGSRCFVGRLQQRV